jgi:hypothetical protein
VKKPTCLALALALVSTLFAATPRAQAQSFGDADRRGQVHVTGAAVKAVTQGPAVLHGYSGFGGGTLFVAPVVAGDDTDCATALAKRQDGGRQVLIADRMAYVPVAAGQVACLVTDTRHSFELLWHAFPTTARETQLASAKH